MIRAIHKESNEIVTSFALTKDFKWKDKEREVFIAPRPEIGNWKELNELGINEVVVSFVKQHKRKYGDKEIDVIPHFRIETDKAIENPLNESEEHQLAKEGIYLKILEGGLFINGKDIKEFEIVDADIEQRLSATKKSVIADVYCKFKEPDQILGKGIVFEIQFSYQNQERTEERTYDRVLQGYSVCWLWRGNFVDNHLKDNHLEIVPFSKAVKEYFQITTQNLAREIYTAQNMYDQYLINLEQLKRGFQREFYEKRQEFIQDIERERKDLKDIQQNFVERNSELIKTHLKKIIEERIIFEVTTELKEVYEKLIKEKLEGQDGRVD